MKLAEAPRLFRGPIARGLAAAAEGRPDSSSGPVDPVGGDQGCGLITGMAVITRGEALGHGLWIDSVFLSQVAYAINASEAGIKQRFTHPGLSGDGMGKQFAKAKNASVEGDIVRADGHLTRAGRKTPTGDLGGFVLQMAMDNPEDFGNSISFEHDTAAENQFLLENGAVVDEDGCLNCTGFRSPDPLNVENLPHCRLKALRAVDVVDDPAANPEGMFRQGQEIPASAEKILCFALGLSHDEPEEKLFDVHPTRVSGFVQRFLSRHGLEVVKKGENMSDTPEEELPVECDVPAEEDPAEPQAPEGEDPVPEKPATPETDPPAEEKPSEMSSVRKFVDAFGEEKGVRYFLSGKSFDDCQKEFVQILVKENADLSATIAKLRGEDPVSQIDPAGVDDPQQVDKQKFQSALGGLGGFAAAVQAQLNSKN